MDKLKDELFLLEEKYLDTKDFNEKLDLANDIHNIKMKINGVKPMDSHIDCVGCGS